MRINLISQENAAGLSRDMALMRSILTPLGHSTTLVDWQDASPPADVNFYFELFDPKHLKTAPKHVGVFNMEWFEPNWREHLPCFTQLWAKSCIAFEWYLEHGYDQAVYTGFASLDLYDKTIPKLRRALHIRGKSRAKGTAAVLAAYVKHGAKLPPLTIVSADPLPFDLPNTQQWIGHISNEKLSELMNSHRYHVAPSSYEGWGHTLVEATACKAIVLTTDASPMNENILPTFGCLITPERIEERGLVTYHHVGADGIISALEAAELYSDEDQGRMGTAARAWFGVRRTQFIDKAITCLKALA